MITLPRQTMALFPSELKEEEEKEEEDEEEETANKNKMASHRFRTDGADGGNKPRRHGNDLQEGNRWKQKRNNKTAISHTKKKQKTNIWSENNAVPWPVEADWRQSVKIESNRLATEKIQTENVPWSGLARAT